MTRGRSQAGVKSHRRGRRRRTRRRIPVAPWLVITTVVTLAASSVLVGYVWLLASGCSGDTERATVVTEPSMRETLSGLARQWENTAPDVGGQCVGVSVRAKPSVEVAQRLGHGWNDMTDGARPHVWVPESTAWLQMAQVGGNGAAMIPDETPLLATSPTVIAMPEPMAEALGWDDGDSEPEVEPTWAELVQLTEDQTWADFGHEEWGEITLGTSSPRESTAGMHALLSLVVDDEDDGRVSSEALANAIRFNDAAEVGKDTVDQLLEELDAEAEAGEVSDYVSAFPALERDVLRYNQDANSSVELTAVYPADGSIDADHPYAVLENAEWTSERMQGIGRQFVDYIDANAGDAFLSQGFRDGTRRLGGDELNNASGLMPQIEVPQQPPPRPEAVNNTVTTWQALTREANVLVVVDTSASMATTETHDGETASRLDIVKDELTGALNLFGSQANVGLWEFSAGLGGNGESHREVLPMAQYDGDYKSQMQDSVAGLMPHSSERGLHDTAVAAYQELLDNYDEDAGAANLVVLISDGGDEMQDFGGRSLDEVEAELGGMADDSTPASIMTIGFGEGADEEALSTIAVTTDRGQYLPAQWTDELDTQMLNALYNVG